MTTDSKVIGKSYSGKDIELFKLSSGSDETVLIIGGVHGDEKESMHVAEKLSGYKEIEKFNKILNIYLLPKLNPDGCFLNIRQNARGVDLNRNMPTKDWTSHAYKEKYNPGPNPGSEIETQVLINVIEEIKPDLIISLHCFEKALINYNGRCRFLAESMSLFNKYPCVSDMGYPTPGSLGTWAGLEKDIPVITLEIKRGCGDSVAWDLNKRAILEALNFVVEKNEIC
jgi:protein MpaA